MGSRGIPPLETALITSQVCPCCLAAHTITSAELCLQLRSHATALILYDNAALEYHVVLHTAMHTPREMCITVSQTGLLSFSWDDPTLCVQRWYWLHACRLSSCLRAPGTAQSHAACNHHPLYVITESCLLCSKRQTCTCCMIFPICTSSIGHMGTDMQRHQSLHSTHIPSVCGAPAGDSQDTQQIQESRSIGRPPASSRLPQLRGQSSVGGPPKESLFQRIKRAASQPALAGPSAPPVTQAAQSAIASVSSVARSDSR